MSDQENGSWHLSKRISIETVVLMLLQTMAVVWFASKLDNRIMNLESDQVSAIEMIERITRLESTVDNLTELVRSQTATIARIDRKIPDEETK